MDFIVLKNHEDINLVEKFKGCEIFVSSDSEITLLENEYHLSEILGLKVFQGNIQVGEVYDVRSFPQGDYIDIILTSKEHAFVPFRDEFVIDVNLEEEFIEVIEMEGLL
jgi:16S rRNA processing protein RimM